MLSKPYGVHVCDIPVVYRRHGFLAVTHGLRLYTALPSPLQQWSLNLGRRVYDKDVTFRTENSTVAHSLHLNKVWVSVLITIHCKQTHLSLKRIEK